MEMYEVKNLLKYKYYSYKESWEQTRLLGYIVAAGNTTKRDLKAEDIIKFQWDSENKGSSRTPISKADIERLQKKAEDYLKTKRH